MGFFKSIVSIFVTLSTLLTSFFCFGNPVVTEEYKVYDNVILFIGDGMGENHIEEAKRQGFDIVMEDFPVRGQSETLNHWGTTTDSAAGGTALATGIRTTNGYIGRTIFDPAGTTAEPMNLTELAVSIDKSAGVVTTDKTSGATPASFSAHAFSRDYNEEISDDQLNSNLTLIWGAKEDYVTEEMANVNGFEYIENVQDIHALKEGQRSFGQFSWDDFANVTNPDTTPTIAKMTKEAIDILDDDKDGFFLMVEGAHIDKFSHNKDINNAVKQLDEMAKAIEYALFYAQLDGSTLVVVTADHETGSVTYDEAQGGYVCTTGSHSNRNVPVFVSDDKAGFSNGFEIENRQIPVQIALCLGAEEGVFPNCVAV